MDTERRKRGLYFRGGSMCFRALAFLSVAHFFVRFLARAVTFTTRNDSLIQAYCGATYRY